MTQKGDIINLIIGEVAIMSFVVAALQFRSNNVWRKREKAMTIALEIKNNLHKHAIILDKSFNYIDLDIENDPIPLLDIHTAICKKNNRGGLIKNKNPNIKNNYILDEKKGKPIQTAIIEHLNAFEFLASGINQGVFDEGCVMDLLESHIIKSYKVFMNYIKHMNEFHSDNKDMWVIWNNLCNLANKHCKNKISVRKLTKP